MQLSVIVPLHNHLALSQAMLASLQATLPAGLDHEIILVDNGSRDGTGKWLQSIAGGPIRAITHPANLGYAVANNRAAAEARGEFVALLNNDLVLLPGWFEPMLELALRPGTGIVGNIHLAVRTREIYHAGVYFDRTGRPFHFQPPLHALKDVTTIACPAVTGACMLMRRSLFAELGGFDEHYLNGYEDIDLCVRALTRGRHAVVAARSATYHHIAASEGRYRREDANAARFEARWGDFARGLDRVEPPPPVREAGATGPAGLSFDRDAYATLQAFHPGPRGYAEQSSTAHLYPTGRWTNVAVPLPHGVVRDGHTLRLDPCDFPATVHLAGFELKENKSGKPVWTVAPEDLPSVLEVSGTAVAVPKVDASFCRVQTRQNDAPTSKSSLTLRSHGTDPQLRLRASAVPATLAHRTDLTAELQLMTELGGPP